ncbi:MAG: TetR family transcriptional regulator [Rubrivivax sp.]|nr:TetR family transcriptional regulator [Rubrivivax sp.]
MIRRTKEEAQQTRDALLDAAEVVFERRGVAATSLQAIAEAAGVTRGAVYWHFRGKADLYIAMMDRAVLPFEQHWLVADPADEDRPLRRLRELLFDILRQVAGDARLRRVVAISMLKVEYVGELDAIRLRHLQVATQAVKRFEALLRLAAAAGQLAPGVSASVAARAVHSLVDGLIINWALDTRAFDLRRTGRLAVRQLLAGLSRPGAAD